MPSEKVLEVKKQQVAALKERIQNSCCLLYTYPWQRGTNENTNGLLREYFPKKQDLTEIKPSLIRDKALILNQRPRKCLNWKSPFEVYFDISLHLT